MAANTVKQYEREYAELAEPGLTKYEVAKAIGMRAYAISYGSRPLVSSASETCEAIEIAKQELAERCIPIAIKRFMPDGTIRLVDINKTK